MHNNKDFGWVEFHHGSDEIALCNLLRAPCYAKWPLYHVKWALQQDAGRTRGWAALLFPPPHGVQACQEYNRKEREKEGEETSHWIFHEWFLSEEKEHLCLWRARGGDTVKAGWDRLVLGTQGRGQSPIPVVKSNLCCNVLRLLLKRTLPLPSVLSACFALAKQQRFPEDSGMRFSGSGCSAP